MLNMISDPRCLNAAQRLSGASDECCYSTQR
jgi:hypothetical protein